VAISFIGEGNRRKISYTGIQSGSEKKPSIFPYAISIELVWVRMIAINLMHLTKYQYLPS
jgi:hypothetical protein